ncbi:TIGR04076 family protein [Chloroflexota bacterium]
MDKVYPVQVTVKSIKGKCHERMKQGTTWLIKEGKTPNGVCIYAWNSIYPVVRVFRHGGEHWWNLDRDVSYVSCPDPENQVIYEVKRLRKM